MAALRAELELQGATGSLVGGVVVTNRGSRPCSLLGGVEVRFLDGSDPAGVKRTSLPATTAEPGVPHPSLHALRPGESAFARISWSNWCGEPTPKTLALTLPAGEIDLRVDGASRCDAPTNPSTLSIGPLQPRAAQPVRASTVPLAAAIVEELHLGQKTVPGVRGTPGRIAVFHVALTGTSKRAFRFAAACPTYIEGTGLDEPSESHVLNCRPVGTIGPGETVVFEMRVRVPERATGRIPLTWTLAPATNEPPFAGGVILVRN
jgi:hypothetical protein